MSWLPIIDSAIQVGGMIGQNQSNLREASRQRNFARDERREQNLWNLQQWNRQNEYNSPSNQVHRMRKAGLNPALFYGQGTPGNAPSPSQGVSPGSYSRANIESITKGLESFSNVVNLENTQAQTKVLEAQADKIRSESSGIDYDNYAKQYEQRHGETIPVEKATEEQKKYGHKVYSMDGKNTLIGYQMTPFIERFTAELNEKRLKNTDQKFQNAISELKAKWAEDGWIVNSTTDQAIMQILKDHPDLIPIAILTLLGGPSSMLKGTVGKAGKALFGTAAKTQKAGKVSKVLKTVKK